MKIRNYISPSFCIGALVGIGLSALAFACVYPRYYSTMDHLTVTAASDLATFDYVMDPGRDPLQDLRASKSSGSGTAYYLESLHYLHSALRDAGIVVANATDDNLAKIDLKPLDRRLMLALHRLNDVQLWMYLNADSSRFSSHGRVIDPELPLMARWLGTASGLSVEDKARLESCLDKLNSQISVYRMAFEPNATGMCEQAE